MKRRKSSEEPGGPVVTPGNAKRALAVGKILAPALLPIVMRAATVARGAWDERKARRLGIEPGELVKYSGRGGALHARIGRIRLGAGTVARRGPQERPGHHVQRRGRAPAGRPGSRDPGRRADADRTSPHRLSRHSRRTGPYRAPPS